MKLKSMKVLGLAALVAGGMWIAAPTGASAAAVSPGVFKPAISADGIVERPTVHKAHRIGRRHWHRRWRHRRPGYRHYYRGYYYANPWWLAPPVVVVPRYRRGNRHVRWCLNRYRSYNPRTDMYLGFDGRYHYCRSPYRY